MGLRCDSSLYWFFHMTVIDNTATAAANGDLLGHLPEDLRTAILADVAPEIFRPTPPTTSTSRATISRATCS